LFCTKKVVLPPTICDIEQVNALHYLAFGLTVSYISFSGHVVNQRFYLLNQLRKQGLHLNGLIIVFNSLVLPRLTYACQAFSGILSEFDLNRLQYILLRLAGGKYVQLGMTSDKFSNGQMTVCSLKLYLTLITVYTSYCLILATHMGIICARVVISIPFR
jgi:hypothetical protein